MNNDFRYERVRYLVQNGRNDEATKITLDLLDENFNDATALFQFGVIMIKERRSGIAYNIFARGCKLEPEQPEMWLNFARTHPDNPENWPVTEWCLNKAIELFNKQNKSDAAAKANLAMLYYIKGELGQAQDVIEEALAKDPNNESAIATQGFIHLANQRWAEAWKYYDVLLRTGTREWYAYGDEPDWDGKKGLRIIISGEQGLGDEIMYASCFEEVIRDSDQVVIECMPRLENLFQRSFPNAKVYGQRWNKEVFWEEDHNPQAHVPMAAIPKFYRLKDEDFRGEPYLIPNKDMCVAIKHMLDRIGPEPKIGIAWTGGTIKTRGFLRAKTLEDFLPIVNSNAIFINLEYNNATKEIEDFENTHGKKIHYFPWLTDKGLDYDYTAALISQLDLVISVPTTAVQVAGALGVETWVLVPKYTGWIFSGNKYVWASSVVPIKNPSMEAIGERLRQWLLTHTPQ